MRILKELELIIKLSKIWEIMENSGGNSYHVQPQECETRDVKTKKKKIMMMMMHYLHLTLKF